MRLEKPAFPWGELFDLIMIGILGGVITMSLAWGFFKFHFPLEAVLQ